MSGANAVKEDRLWQRHADMAKLGGTPRGGVNRQALSAEDAAARNQLAAWAQERRFAIFADRIGNLFVVRSGTDAGAAPVLSGSHMDSQPTGGRFDGMYGVLAAFEALEALEDAGIDDEAPGDGGRLDQRGRLALPARRDGLGGVRRRLQRSTRCSARRTGRASS